MFKPTRILLLSFMLLSAISSHAIELTRSTIVYNAKDAALVGKMAQLLADDVERVSGIRPQVKSGQIPKHGEVVILATTNQTRRHPELKGCWERYAIDTEGERLYITGSDPRGLAYGVLHISQQIGVSPWYWWADVPTEHREHIEYEETMVSQEPSIHYRGLFVNDEDWGMKTWAANNYERELGDIGPKTYDKICELILRLHGNMLAPAMHTCTGAFYSHPESQVMADKWGIMITTSHCEPLLFNNAAPSEWDKDRDGEWNYMTNRETILSKLDARLRETAPYDNIYTMGMRGLHDEAMKGSTDPHDRARTLEKVFSDQRDILERHKHRPAQELPQIFVPYKETLDIYDSGLRVPDDITLVWPDDNYGYMKRVTNAEERNRKGGSGVYYHLSYLGTPHDYLWLFSTAPVLMYEELRKAYDAGADRYWLLNVGDIKPLEVEVQQFFDMAWNFEAFSAKRAKGYQAQWLAQIFGQQYLEKLQDILDTYYRLAWVRKPEYMGYEIQWDNAENERLHDSQFSFDDGSAQQRLRDYAQIADKVELINRQLKECLRPAFFELLGYQVLSAEQMNRKFLFAQLNHETGSPSAANRARQAQQQIEELMERYNGQLGGKWDQMMSEVPPGFVSQYQRMPVLCDSSTTAFRLPDNQIYTTYEKQVNLGQLKTNKPFSIVEGIGTYWQALKLGEPLAEVCNPKNDAAPHLDIALELPPSAHEVKLQISVVPFWPVALDRSNRLAVSVDGGEPVVMENRFEEWSAEWKLQVLNNRKDFLLTLPLDENAMEHWITLYVVDPGQMIQEISYEGVKPNL